MEFANLHGDECYLDDSMVRIQNLSSCGHEAKLMSILGINVDSTNARKGLFTLDIKFWELESGSINLVYYTISIYT